MHGGGSIVTTQNGVEFSIIIACLQSYIVVREQMLHFKNILNGRHNWEFILVDDGSDPPIKPELVDYNFTLFQTHDKRPWTQPCARNFGAKHARGKYFFFTDIDHIITAEALDAVERFEGDMIKFKRIYGVLDYFGNIVTNADILEQYGKKPDHQSAGEHFNTFAIRREIFEQMKGYDQKFCGKYGGDDTDFMRRYGELHYANPDKVARSWQSGIQLYVYPEPKADRKEIFHDIRRKIVADRRKHVTFRNS